MKYSYAGFGMIMLGLFAFVIVMLFQSITINNESDYYALKEAMEASLYESIDIPYYRNAENGAVVKIVEEKFVENFTKRFVKNTMGNSEGYVIEFYDIMESPPKATVVIKNETDSITISDTNFDVVNNLTGILVQKVDEDYNCEFSQEVAYYYSYVKREINKLTNKKIITNKNEWNLNPDEDFIGDGQLLRPYTSFENDSNYKYTYSLNDYYYLFYNVYRFKGVDCLSDTLRNIYNDFTNITNKICGYPYYYNQDKEYAYPSCVNRMNSYENGDAVDDVTTSSNIDKVNFKKNFIDVYSNYLDAQATDIDVTVNLEKLDMTKEEHRKYLSLASNNKVSSSDKLYLISWEGTWGNSINSVDSNYNVLMVLEVTWDVKKCPK